MKKILQNLKENWITYGFETLVVIVGILGAFALNNWNENRKRNLDEQAVLQLLKEDMVQAKEQSTEFLREEEAHIERIKAALGADHLVDSLLGLPVDQQIPRAIFWDFQHELPVFRAYTDLKNSDRINAIQSPDVRKALTLLEEALHSLDFMLGDRRTVHFMRIDAIAENHLNFLQVMDQSVTKIEKGEASDYRALLKDQHVRNLLAIKIELAISVSRARRTLDEQIDEVILQLDKAL